MTTNTKKRRGFLRSPLSTAKGPTLSIDGLRHMAEKDPTKFVRLLDDLITSGELRIHNLQSITALCEALDGIQVPTQVYDPRTGGQRTIITGAFPLVTGGLMVAGVNDAYEDVPTVGEELVQDMDDAHKNTTLTGVLTHVGLSAALGETDDLPLISAGQERFDIGHRRNGYRVQISADMIRENAIPEIQGRFTALGTFAAEDIEEQTLERVTDHFGSGATPAAPYALWLNKSGTQLYNGTANNPGTRAPSGTRVTNNALNDSSNLEAARVVLTAMQNSRGKRIAIPMSEVVVLVPDALAFTTSTLLNSQDTPGVVGELNPFGPRGGLRPGRFISTPKLDDLSSAAWYMGAFRRQFRRKWKVRVNLASLSGEGTEGWVRKRIAFESSVEWDVEVGAVDYVYVVQSLSGTTAPVDE